MVTTDDGDGDNDNGDDGDEVGGDVDGHNGRQNKENKLKSNIR